MEIRWTPNPLRTVVVLNDADRWWLREALVLDCPSDVESEPSWANRFYAALEDALRDIHVGDCTCDPCSCLKCHAEAYLGIDTTPGLNKWLGHKIADAFDTKPERTLDEAIAVLANYAPAPSFPMWEDKMDLWNSCLPSWREEARQAHDWLIRYRDRLTAAHRQEA